VTDWTTRTGLGIRCSESRLTIDVSLEVAYRKATDPPTPLFTEAGSRGPLRFKDRTYPETIVVEQFQIGVVSFTNSMQAKPDRLNRAQRRSGPLAALLRKTQRLRSGVASPPAPKPRDTAGFSAADSRSG
jgi:hypothetical protein